MRLVLFRDHTIPLSRRGNSLKDKRDTLSVVAGLSCCDEMEIEVRVGDEKLGFGFVSS